MRKAGAVTALLLAALAVPASSQTSANVPGADLRGVGLVVPDADTAASLFTDVLGVCRAEWTSTGYYDKGLPTHNHPTLGHKHGAHVPTFSRVAVLECGANSELRLFEMSDEEKQVSLAQHRPEWPSVTAPGHAVLGFVVDDLAAALARLQRQGGGSASEPAPFTAHDGRKGRSAWATASWGVAMELVQWDSPVSDKDAEQPALYAVTLSVQDSAKALTLLQSTMKACGVESAWEARGAQNVSTVLQGLQTLAQRRLARATVLNCAGGPAPLARVVEFSSPLLATGEASEDSGDESEGGEKAGGSHEHPSDFDFAHNGDAMLLFASADLITAFDVLQRGVRIVSSPLPLQEGPRQLTEHAAQKHERVLAAAQKRAIAEIEQAEANGQEAGAKNDDKPPKLACHPFAVSLEAPWGGLVHLAQFRCEKYVAMYHDEL